MLNSNPPNALPIRQLGLNSGTGKNGYTNLENTLIHKVSDIDKFFGNIQQLFFVQINSFFNEFYSSLNTEFWLII